MTDKVSAVQTEEAPPAVGPYSQATVAGGVIYCSGQIGLDPKTGKMVDGGVEAQAHQVLSNLKAVLTQAGSDMTSLMKVNIYLTNMADFSKINKIYQGFLSEPFPARATVEVRALPLGALVEMDAIAQVKNK